MRPYWCNPAFSCLSFSSPPNSSPSFSSPANSSHPREQYYLFSAPSVLCCDIMTEMVGYEICFLTSALSHFRVYFSHVVDYWVALASCLIYAWALPAHPQYVIVDRLGALFH